MMKKQKIIKIPKGDSENSQEEDSMETYEEPLS
jgi:hypothetical protein